MPPDLATRAKANQVMEQCTLEIRDIVTKIVTDDELMIGPVFQALLLSVQAMESTLRMAGVPDTAIQAAKDEVNYSFQTQVH